MTKAKMTKAKEYKTQWAPINTYAEPNAQKMVLWNPGPDNSRLEMTLPLDAGVEVLAKTLASLNHSGWYVTDTYKVFVEEGGWA